MKKEDLIQDLSVCGLAYVRILVERVEPDAIEELKKRYRYIHIYSYAAADLVGFQSRSQSTLFIDLSKNLDVIFSRFNATARKHVRRAEKNNDLQLKVMDSDRNRSYALYRQVKRAEGAAPDMQREFSNCFFFNAYWKGKMIVTMSFYDNGTYIRAKHTASLRKSMGEETAVVAHASRALIWEVCKWGKANGRRVFDLAGVNYDDPAKAGIAAFKESFGGIAGNMHIYRYETKLFSAVKRGLAYFGRNIN